MAEKKEGKHARLDEQKKEYDLKMKVIKEIEKEKAKREKEEERQKQKKREAEMAAAKQKLQVHNEEKKEVLAKQHQAKARQAEAERQRQLEQVKLKKPKVDERQKQGEGKVMEKRMIVEAKKHFLEEKQERLDRVVEQYANRPQVEADQERLIQETAAREIRKNTVQDASDNAKLFQNPGYTVDRLMGDVRYKVSAALFDAGLQNTAYGQQLLQGIGQKQRDR